ncbi:GGDEF domain-containing protein [Caldalkalibacillus salinus]|uniref:GGDEF domain-containing protein n=1 Tax=Caldalkalibacillus salinus TaxID=2803787 RepID=UPI001922F31A|nr:GGDEF domain-containing protein [Caldalkalibacillus salinus]
MKVHELDSLNIKKWNRRIINNLWLILLISFFVANVNLILTTYDKVSFIINYVILPSVVLFVILLMVEVFTRLLSPQLNSYFIIFFSGAIAFALVYHHYSVKGIESIFLLPILFSCIYFNHRKVLYASFISLIYYSALLFTHPTWMLDVTLTHIISMVSILFFGGVIALNIMIRGVELLRHLEDSIKSSEELMISKVVIEKVSKTDALTEVNNHRAFQEYTDYLLRHAHESTLHLAVLDLDNFKKINDTYGHQKGDIVLKQTAKRLKRHVSHDDFVARYGGEEFVIVFIDKQSEEVYEALEKIRQEIESMSLDNVAEQITISIGLHTYEQNMSKDEWFSGADSALYEAKQSGKNKVVVYKAVQQQRGGYAG